MKKKNMMKSITLIFCAIGLVTAAQAAENDAGWSGGPGGFGDEGGKRQPGPGRHQGPGGPGGPGRGGLAGREAMKVCATAAGVTLTEGQRPSFTEEQRTAVDSCVKEKEDAVQSCVAAAGITLPERPQPGQRPAEGQKPPRFDEATKNAIDNCRSQVLGVASAATTESAEVTSKSAK